MPNNLATRADDKRLRNSITHCRKGHEFTEETTGWQRKHGRRFCRVCERQRYESRRDTDPEFRESQRQKMAKWRSENRSRDRKNWTTNRAQKKAWVDNFRQDIGCGLCPERHPACLEFHHIDPKEKDVNVSYAISRWSIERLQAEIAKCVVLCSNCHRKLHWEERQQSKESSW